MTIEVTTVSQDLPVSLKAVALRLRNRVGGEPPPREEDELPE